MNSADEAGRKQLPHLPPRESARFPPTPLKQWMAFWRAEATRHWPWREEKPIWQKDFFDRQLRRGESYAQKWHYMRENPVRDSLVPDANAWPWQGELHPLVWHEGE